MAVILNSRQTGSVTMTKPWYFDYIDAILGDKDKITTPLARDTEREHLSNKYKSDFLTETPTEKAGPSNLSTPSVSTEQSKKTN